MLGGLLMTGLMSLRIYQQDDSSSKELLTGNIIANALTSDTAVNNLVDPRITLTDSTGATGIFRDTYCLLAEG